MRLLTAFDAIVAWRLLDARESALRHEDLSARSCCLTRPNQLVFAP